MLNIPGYTLLDAAQATGTSLLFHAVRESDGLRLLLKTPGAASPGPREFERYRREFAILQRLSEVRGVTRAHAYHQLPERPVLLLEPVQGVPLSELTGSPLEVGRALALGINLAHTLAVLHRRGVIHKDIKPSNIIVTPQGDTCLIDFGIATCQLVEHVEAAPAPFIEGTLAYMSPEQTGRMNRSVDYRTDLYSLGITLYEVLTGSPPFQGRDALEWFHAHLALLPPRLSEQVPGLPPVLSAILSKLLAKVAEERYQSAEGLKADLEQCLDQLRLGTRADFPTGVNDFPSRFQLPQRLYGRDTHVAQLLQGFERIARGGRPELVLVRGYSGIGKSVVVNELHKPVVRQRGFFLSGKFDQFQRDIPYATLAQSLRSLTQQLLASTDEELARWSVLLREAWEGQGQLLVDMVPQLELVAGKQPPIEELPPAQAQHRFARVFRKLLGVLATPQHPLVIFLDDLQWADLASLQLIQHLLTHPDAPPVLWIGAYRDNEVDASHSLMHVLAELRKAGAQVAELQLEPLSQEEVRQLVADALPGADEELVAPLSAVVREKTGGNPFFLLQFMRTLHQDGLLVRTIEGLWRWEAERVRTQGYSDNVVEFMAGKLRQLPAGTQHLLRLAACVGNTFPLPLLHLISGMEEVREVEQGLEPALQEGMVVGAGPERCRFLHDRIQQAAYALIPEEERAAVHLRIGRLLLASTSSEALQENLFSIVTHLNTGSALITGPEERHRLAQLNAQAGRKARLSTAFRAAASYFMLALQLLPEDPWQAHAPLAFTLLAEQATCEFMSGNAARARELAGQLLPRARTHAELASVYRLKSTLLFIAGEIQASIECLLECLAQLGMPMSLHPTWEEVVAANEEVWAELAGRSIESLVALPRMTDPDMEALMSVLGNLFLPAYLTNPRLLTLHLCRTVLLLLKHGHTATAPQAYVWYGVVVGSTFGRYAEGQAFAQLAGAIVDRHELSTQRGKVLYVIGLVSVWVQPLPRTQSALRKAFEHALQASDLNIACFCCFQAVVNRLAIGEELEDVAQEAISRLAFVRKVGSAEVQYILVHLQSYVHQLQGRARQFGSLSWEEFDEEAFEAGLSAARMSTMRCWYWSLKMQARFMAGLHEEALEAGNKAAELAWSSLGQLPLLGFHLFRALCLAACASSQSAEAQRETVAGIRGHQQQLAEWAQHSPSTFLAPERLVSAELARVTGRQDEALQAYEEALQAAREYGFVQYAALACELAARYWQQRRMATIADTYALKAREAYLRWGALGKVLHLDTQWPHLVVAPPLAQGTLSDTSPTQIDALTLVKAQQAISGEMVLERLAATLLRVAIENAGAQRGALLLPRDGALAVAAESGSAGDSPLPWTLIAYVKRTREHVLIGDTSQPHAFFMDAGLAEGQARSILCLPLMRQEEFLGALYLENSLATNAFTPARLSLLGHLASQAVISMENARLYSEVQRTEAALRQANDGLERRVEERTRELKRAQARLVDSARAAGMAEVAASVLHNVGNVLTSAVINLQTMRAAVGASRLGQLGKVCGLLEEHRDDLPGFFAKEGRGAQLPSYLAALSGQLVRDQTALQQDMEAMDRHLEHIRAIIRIQRSYARDSLITEECELRVLVEEALSIQLPSLRKAGVTIIQHLGATLPKLQLDKHKVLQILINLLSNAQNAMKGQAEDQRTLHVRLEAVGSRARIQVVDNGMGIALELRPRLFSQGFTTREGGHGLGLHSSALAARMMGGQLTLESEGPGQGATATLELPLA